MRIRQFVYTKVSLTEVPLYYYDMSSNNLRNYRENRNRTIMSFKCRIAFLAERNNFGGFPSCWKDSSIEAQVNNPG